MGAAQGTMNNFIWGNDRIQYYETICGGAGATAEADGCSAVHTHMTNSRLTDPEVLEWRFPVVLETFHLRSGSGGSGRHRGGDGVVRRVRFGEAMEVNVLSGHRKVPPYGAAGGEPGAVGHSRKIAVDGTITEFGASLQTTVEPGDRFEIETPGRRRLWLSKSRSSIWPNRRLRWLSDLAGRLPALRVRLSGRPRRCR